MRGSLRQRSKGSWSIILDLGDVADPVTGRLKRQQKWQTFHGPRKAAEAHLADLLKTVRDGQYVEASALTLGAWLREWFAASKTRFRANTVTRYRGIIDRDLVPSALGPLRLQLLRATHLEAYYAAATVSASTLTLHHTILYSALKTAKRDGLVPQNVAIEAVPPKRTRHKSDEARMHCWTAHEARRFLETARSAGSQPAAFYSLALDSGARKGELCGLTWNHLDLEAGKLQIVQQLLTPGPAPVFGPPKTGQPRTIALGPDAVALLRAHRQAQRELKMRHRQDYADFGLVFAKEWSDLQTRGARLGHPLQLNNLGQREYAALIKTAGVKPIKFHGMRHTCATLLLQARTPVHVVSERLGHAKVSTTLETYAHVLPDMQTDAAATLNAILYG